MLDRARCSVAVLHYARIPARLTPWPPRDLEACRPPSIVAGAPSHSGEHTHASTWFEEGSEAQAQAKAGQVMPHANDNWRFVYSGLSGLSLWSQLRVKLWLWRAARIVKRYMKSSPS